jgi:hypothetical protein
VPGRPSRKRYDGDASVTVLGRAFARHVPVSSKTSWLLFFVLGALTAFATAPIQLLGNPPDPPSPEGFTGLSSDEMAARIPGVTGYIGSIARQLGNFMLATGLLMMAVAAVPFRKGERWAWYTMWVAPLMILIQLLNSRGGSGWQVDLGFVVLTSAGLIWPYRRFFPKKPRP